MAFHEVQFPNGIANGAVGGPKFDTTVIEIASGFEKRNQNWANARAEYDVSHGIKDQGELDELIAFFRARAGKAHGFRFKDWVDFTLAEQSIGFGDDATVLYQLFKRYSSGGVNHDRTLTKVVTGTVVVKKNTTVQADPGDYTIDLDTGLITFDVAPTGSEEVFAACEFDVPVRFDTDHLRARIDDYNNYTWGQIPLIELRIV